MSSYLEANDQELDETVENEEEDDDDDIEGEVGAK